MRTDPSGREIVALDVDHRGERISIKAKWVVLSAGAVNSAALLLRSADDKLPEGVANRSGMVGRNFMTHHSTAMMSVDPRTRSDAVYQKTIASNDYYFDDGEGGPPLGHIQAIGKVSAFMLRAFAARAPMFFLRWLCSHSVDWFLVSEDLPRPGNRLRVDGSDRIVFEVERPNWPAHMRLVSRMKRHLRAARLPVDSHPALRPQLPDPPVRHRAHGSRSGRFSPRSLVPQLRSPPTSGWWTRAACPPPPRSIPPSPSSPRPCAPPTDGCAMRAPGSWPPREASTSSRVPPRLRFNGSENPRVQLM